MTSRFTAWARTSFRSVSSSFHWTAGLALLPAAALLVLMPMQEAHGKGAAPHTVSHASLHTRPERKYELRMHHLHTGESIDVVYRVGDHYVPSAVVELDRFLRDHRTEDVTHYDPREFDVLHSLMAKLGRPDGLIDVVCGYRTPWSNHYLRTRGADTGVAQHSQHMLGKAIDIRVPGVSTRRLDQAALSLHAGGVGYYPISHFVHVDVGPVRRWTFAGSGD